ncbi:MAG: DEAD/DEAH box helicase, partial [Nanoarchaeota archaeon]
TPQEYKWRVEQRNDINWLLDTTKSTQDNPLGQGGGLITRVTGAGKTNTALGFFGNKLKDNPDYKAIIAVPRGRAEQWVSEANRFSTLPVVLIPEGTAKDKVDEILLDSKPGTIFVTGHREIARSHEMMAALQTNNKLKAQFDGIVIDEPQELQTRASNIGAFGRRIMKLPVNHKIGLTATPARKSPLEVFDLIRWTQGTSKQIGSKEQFRRIFSGFGSGTNSMDTSIRKVFYNTISPYISGDRLTTPQFKVIQNSVDITRTPEQINRQKDIERKSSSLIERRRNEIIQEVKDNPTHRLRRSKNWEFRLIQGGGARELARKEVEEMHKENIDGGDWKSNSRMLALKNKLEEDKKKKHVIFIDSKIQRHSLMDMLGEMGYSQNQIKNIASSTTSITGKEMSERVKDFRTGKVPIILIDKNSASGFNLQNGDVLNVLGSPIDGAQYLQAQGRLARSPRKGNVEVNTYKYKDNPGEQMHWNNLENQIKLLRATAPGLTQYL